MKIAIIGAGWVGCHLAKHLMLEHSVTVFEQKSIFSGSSSNNQNRLHLGFHYARSYKTRMLCKTTFNEFAKEYGDFIKRIPNNHYAVADSSVIDYQTYKDICEYSGLDCIEHSTRNLKNIQGCICVDEMYINFTGLVDYFSKLLEGHIVKKQICSLDELSDYDIIINCTNNFIQNTTVESFYELTLSLVYRLTSTLDFGALTIVDGPFVSLFPYKSNLYTLTDVEHTPVLATADISEIQKMYSHISEELVAKKRSLIEEKVNYYYPDFCNKFEYQSYFLAVKSKFNNSTSDRSPVVSRTGNVIHCFTGKIQGIYPIVKKVLSSLNAYEKDFNR